LFSLPVSHTAEYCRIIANRKFEEEEEELLLVNNKDIERATYTLYWSDIAVPEVCSCFIC
jgi:hypothetical protein